MSRLETKYDRIQRMARNRAKRIALAKANANKKTMLSSVQQALNVIPVAWLGLSQNKYTPANNFGKLVAQ